MKTMADQLLDLTDISAALDESFPAISPSSTLLPAAPVLMHLTLEVRDAIYDQIIDDHHVNAIRIAET